MDAPPNPPPSPLAETAARRFPLVARPQVIPRPPEVRLNQIQTRADQASHGGPDALLRAAEALNLAALLASDCGDADLARALCHQQFAVLHAARPHPAATAKLTLQPLINLARLRIRAGNGTAAFTLLHDLFGAIGKHASIDIDGQSTDLSDLVHPGDRAEVRTWLWTILLTDGIRALARVGQWDTAHAYAVRLRGIDRHLTEGRQIAVLDHIFNHRPAAAHALLHASDLADTWEETVAACLTVLSQHVHDQPADDAVQQMVTRYLGLRPDRPLVTITGKLGLTILDLLNAAPAEPATPDPHTTAVLEHLVTLATASGNGPTARDLLHHPASAFLSTAQENQLTALTRLTGQEASPPLPALLPGLLAAVELSKTTLRAQTLSRPLNRAD